MTLLINKDKKRDLTIAKKINAADFMSEIEPPEVDHDAELVAEVRAVADAIKAIEPESTDLTQVVGALNSVAAVLNRVAKAMEAMNWKRAHATVTRGPQGIERLDFVKD